MGMTDWSGFHIMGMDIMGFEDFLVSNNLLPLGSIVYLLFCTTRYGWGWKNFVQEANEGVGVRFPAAKAYRFYLTFILPVIMIMITVQAYVKMLKG